MLTMCTTTIIPSESIFVVLSPILCYLTLVPLSYLVLILISSRFAPFLSKQSAFLIAGGTTALGTALMPLSVLVNHEAIGGILYLCAAVAAAFGNALLLIMWGELWSALATGRVGRHLYASYTFAFVLFFASYLLPSLGKVFYTAAMPIVSVIILRACENEPVREPSVVPLDIKTVPVIRLLACVFLISVIWGTSQGMIGVYAASDVNFLDKMLLLAGAGIGAVTLSLVLSQLPSEALALYQPVIPAAVIGLIVLLIEPMPYPFLGAGLIVMSVYCLDMLIMLVSTDVAYRARLSIAITFGLAIFIARTGTLAGSFLADWLAPLTIASAYMRSNTFLVAVCALALIGMLFFTINDVKNLYVTPRAEAHDASLEEKCKNIARVCKLTNRESEVLLLLAQGRSVPYISEDLHIAQGTTKHHVSNIYRKVGTFDRQGLLDAIQQGGL